MSVQSKQSRPEQAEAPRREAPPGKNPSGEKPPPEKLTPEKPPSEKPLPKTWYTEWQPRTFDFVPLEDASKASKADGPLATGIPRPLQPVLAVLALLAVAALLILFALPHRTHPKTLAAGPPAASPAAASPPPSVATAPAARAVPLTVTLFSTGEGRHVSVGTPVTVAAYATLAHGQSATLSVSFRRGQGPKMLLSLAQGSLSSAIWTPLTPGRYVFRANVLDERKRSAFSRRVTIWADAPPGAPVRPAVAARAIPAKAAPIKPVSAPVKPVVRVAAYQAARRAAKPAIKPAARPVARVAAKPAAHVAAKPAARVAARRPMRRVQPRVLKPRLASLPPVHVVAAAFPYQRNAAILADALRARGFHAVARKGVNGAGQPAYVVQTGIYLSAAAAQKQLQQLQSDGYPAYSFKDHAP